MKFRKSATTITDIRQAHDSISNLNRNLEKLRMSGIVSDAVLDTIESGISIAEIELEIAESQAWKEAIQNGEILCIVV